MYLLPILVSVFGTKWRSVRWLVGWLLEACILLSHLMFVKHTLILMH